MTSTDAPERRSLAEEVRSHLGLVLTTAGAMLLITRVYIASGRETGTALAVLRSAGLLPTALGVTTTLLPALAVVAATGMALLAASDVLSGVRPGRAALAAGTAVIAAAFVPVSATSLARVAALTVLPALALLRLPHLPSAAALWGATVAGILGLNVLTSSVLWLPAERVSVLSDSGLTVTYVGYVLDEQGDALQVLHHAPRLVLQLPTAEVVERVQCRLPDAGSQGERASVLSYLLARVDVGSPVSGSPLC